jgi:hypothetical protein
MFSKLLGKSTNATESNIKPLQEYLSNLGLSEIRTLLLGQVEKFPVDEEMIIEILKKMTHQEEKTGKRFIEVTDNDMKLKKTFDIVITAASSKKMSVDAIELIQKFIQMYTDLIEAFDKRNKQIYMHKLTKAIELSIEMVEQMTAYMNKMAVINR